MFEHLFAPIKIRDMELKNRIILPAMGTRMAAENGAVTDKLIAYHAARAKGGCALNIVEVSRRTYAKVRRRILYLSVKIT